MQCKTACPLYPRTRTFGSTITMSARGEKLATAVSHSIATDRSFRLQVVWDRADAWPVQQLPQEAMPGRVTRPAPGPSLDPSRFVHRIRDRLRRSPSLQRAAAPPSDRSVIPPEDRRAFRDHG